MNEEKVLYFITLITICLMITYNVCVVTGHSNEARRIGELLTIIVIALTSYYFGYSKRHTSGSISHITKKTINRLGYVLLGVGLTLLCSHAILFGIDLTFSELLLGHEWIGLYVIIVSMICIGVSENEKVRPTRV